MFRKSTKNTAPGLFTSFSQQLSAIKQKGIEDSTAWHNIFHEHVTKEINEDLFSVLFKEGIGRSNSPIRVLIAMSILKEGHGWSDEQLFEHCRYNILVMSALGYTNFSDDIPTESTYYLFRQKLHGYQIETGTDLVGECFKDLTKYQAISKRRPEHGKTAGLPQWTQRNRYRACDAKHRVRLHGCRHF